MISPDDDRSATRQPIPFPRRTTTVKLVPSKVLFWKKLQDDFPSFLGVTLAGTVGTLELAAATESGERLLRNHMTTWHHHGWILVGGLLLGDWADEDGVELVGGGEGDFDLR